MKDPEPETVVTSTPLKGTLEICEMLLLIHFSLSLCHFLSIVSLVIFAFPGFVTI